MGHNERGGLVKRKITFDTWGVNSSVCACMCACEEEVFSSMARKTWSMKFVTASLWFHMKKPALI